MSIATHLITLGFGMIFGVVIIKWEQIKEIIPKPKKEYAKLKENGEVELITE